MRGRFGNKFAGIGLNRLQVVSEKSRSSAGRKNPAKEVAVSVRVRKEAQQRQTLVGQRGG